MRHRLHQRHEPVRPWWAPWRRRCACGVGWYPCPDAPEVAVQAPPVVRSLRLDDLPDWDGPTWQLPTVRPPRNRGPLLTRGQAWRSRQGRW